MTLARLHLASLQILWHGAWTASASQVHRWHIMCALTLATCSFKGAFQAGCRGSHASIILCDPCRGWARSSCSTAVLHTIHWCCASLCHKWARCCQRWPASDSRPSGESAQTIQLNLTAYIQLLHSLSGVTLKSSFSDSRTTCCRVSVAASGTYLKSFLVFTLWHS